MAVSYLPDVYRENPSAPAQRLLNGYRWEARGTAPDRNAVRVNVNSALQLNARWRAYAGYEFEGRNKAVAHRFNAGVSFAYCRQPEMLSGSFFSGKRAGWRLP